MTKVLVGLYEVPEKPANAIESDLTTQHRRHQRISWPAHRSARPVSTCLTHALVVRWSLLFSFIKEYLGASVSADTEKLKSTIDSQAKLIEEKDREIQQLKKQVRDQRAHNNDDTSARCSRPPILHVWDERRDLPRHLLLPIGSVPFLLLPYCCRSLLRAERVVLGVFDELGLHAVGCWCDAIDRSDPHWLLLCVGGVVCSSRL